MKAFQFPLEKVLQFRQKQWESATAALADIQRRHHLADLERQKAADGLRIASERLLSCSTLVAADVHVYAMTKDSGERSLEELDRRLAELETQLTTQRQCCLEAKRNFELLERLRQSRRAVWLKELDREEEALGTEAFLARRAQRRIPAIVQMPTEPTRPEPASGFPADRMPDEAPLSSAQLHALAQALAAPVPDFHESREESSLRIP